MKNFKSLAFKYLKQNKRRCMVTVTGVAVAAMVLYALLNFGWCYILELREDERKDGDYEIILYTETEEQIDQILSDEKVKSAYVGQYYVSEEEQYDKALYINTIQPYRMDSIFRYLVNRYGVQGTINRRLQEAYFQGDRGNIIYVALVGSLFVAYLFAIFGIGIVRNSIQLFTLEQIKDYGNLRCIGASKKQLKSIVYLEGFLLEIIGNILAIPFGLLICKVAGYFFGVDVSFHAIPMIPVFAAFFLDLYFVMQDSCKVIVNLSPVSAIRGEYRIRKEKFKVRRKSLYGRIFGLEGDYAYKNIMRNPGRFRKTIWAMGIGIGASITCFGIISTIRSSFANLDEIYRYFQDYYITGSLDSCSTMDMRQAELPDNEYLKTISNMKQVESAKRIYCDTALTVDWRDFWKHDINQYPVYGVKEEDGSYVFDSDYSETQDKPIFLSHLEETELNIKRYEEFMASRKTDDSIDEHLKRYLQQTERYESEILFWGYDEEDYNRYADALVDGTMDLSGHGILLINGGDTEVDEVWYENEYDEGVDLMDDLGENMLFNMHMKHMTYTDYKVGDTVTFLDMAEYHRRLEKEVPALRKQYHETYLKQLEESVLDYDEVSEEEKTRQEEWDFSNSCEIEETANRIRNDMLREGAVKTYTIEGIIDHDVNYNSEITGGHFGQPMFVLPLDRFFEETGMGEEDMMGMGYHFKSFNAKSYYHELDTVSIYSDGVYRDFLFSYYSQYKEEEENMIGIVLGVMLVVLFIVSMTIFNSINTTAGNLHMRRKEFAQLRVIGVSKKQLFRMIMLEGVISTVASNVIGIAIGVGIHYGALNRFYKDILGIRFHFPYLGALLAFMASVVILCGSVYFPLRNMKINMAADLATAEE